MDIVRAAMGLAPGGYRIDERLLELTFGAWEGSTLEQLRLTEPALVADRELDKWGFVPPGGESYRMLSDRVRGWLDELKRPTVAVAHGGVGRVLLGLIGGLEPNVIVNMDFYQDRILVFERGTVRWL